MGILYNVHARFGAMYKFTCPGCKSKLVGMKVLLKHIKKDCNVQRSRLRFKCGESLCLRSFGRIQSLKAHLLNHHCKNGREQLTSNEEEITGNTSVETINDDGLLHCLPSTSVDYGLASFIDSDNLKKKLSETIALMYANPRVPRNVVQIFIESYSMFICQKESSLLNTLRSMQHSKAALPCNLEKFLYDSIFLDRTLFDDFKTEYARLKHFSSEGTYVEPVEITIGERSELVRKKGKPSTSSTPCTLQIIPIHSVLKQFFSMKNVLRDTLSYIDSLSTTQNLGLYSNIMHGSSWQELVSKYTEDGDLHLPVILYEDDFETSNPLGTKTGTYKLAGVYVSLPCLPPQYFSTLNCIFTVALYHSSDRVAFGNHMIFELIIQHLNLLSKEGITVNTDVFKGVIKFHVAAVTGDNLGLHSILGFVESFRANFPCRICLADKTKIN